MMVTMVWLWECPSVSWGVRGLPWVTDLFLHWRLAWWYEWRVECERVNRAAMAPAFNGQSSGRFTIWLSWRSLAVVHNLFSSIENLHTSSSKHVLALKDNTPRFLRLFQLRNRRGAQILLFNASTLLVRRLVHLFRVGRGTLLEERGGGGSQEAFLRHLIFGCFSGKTEDSWFKNTMIKTPALFYFEWKRLLLVPFIRMELLFIVNIAVNKGSSLNLRLSL